MSDTLTHDAFLGGRLFLWQPRKGYRAGVDPVLLAASVPAHPGDRVLDLGCGVGAVALCLHTRVPGVALTGIERQSAYADLARRNAGSADFTVVEGDLTDLPTGLRQQSFDFVLANPPYFPGHGRKSAPDPGREAARAEDTPLDQWIDVAARRLAPKGWLHVIQRAERLPDMLAAVAPRLGSIEVLPLAARTNRAAHLILLRARKDGRGPFRLHAPLVLHDGPAHLSDAEDYRPDIAAILRNGAPLHWPA